MCKQSTIDKINSGTHIVVPKWTMFLRVISPMAIITLSFYIGIKVERNDSHIEDDLIHVNYKENVILFVPRTEVEIKLDNINEKLDKLNENYE